MKIIKYQKVGKKYRVFFSNGKNLLLYEDVILKFELLLKKEVQDLSSLISYNEKYELYDKTLGYINKKLRSEKEIRKYLEKYTDDNEVIENIVKSLKEKGFLNNDLYIKSYIHDRIYLSLDGPLKIKNDLEKLGFKSEIIEEELKIFDTELIKERINKYLNKQSKINKKSLYVFKNKMLMNLLNLGYDKSNIVNCLENIKVDDTNLKEKEEEKLRKKYSNKYQGEELEYFIKRKLYEKGFRK